MKIPILNGIYSDSTGDFRTSYPRNLIPVPKDTGINSGFLRPAEGIATFGYGAGQDRGGINWNGVLYRVMGDKLMRFDESGAGVEIGTVDGNDFCCFSYSFDRLAINGGEKLYYYDGSTFVQVTDVDLGVVLSQIWVDGYFMTTDGAYIVTTELNDPTSVLPLKYGSSEVNPDPIKLILAPRDEPHAINRYTTEVFRNVGGSGFPFQRIDGAQIPKGAVGSRAACVLNDIAIVMGGGVNEPVAVWSVRNGQYEKLSSREVDMILAEFTEDQLSTCVLEPRIYRSHSMLYIHLPDRTLVYDDGASSELGEKVWFVLTSGTADTGRYKGRGIVYCYNKWIVGDPDSNKLGYLTNDTCSHYGSPVSWDLSTKVIYNESHGAIIHAMELVSMPGRLPAVEGATIWTQYSTDGVTWSQRRYTGQIPRGSLNYRPVWLQCGYMNNWRIQKFGGTSDAALPISRLEAQIEALYV